MHYPTFVQYRCSRCHTVFEDAEVCPACKAEAGLEPVKGVPPAMRMFGLLLAAVIVVTLAGGLFTRVMGGG